MRLVCDRDDDREKFQEQLRILRAVADTCKAQVGLPPSQLLLPDAIHLRRREAERVRSDTYYHNSLHAHLSIE